MKIGILGGGQLGRMLALAGYPLGATFRFFDPTPDSCAGQVGELMTGSYDDHDALQRFADGLDVITYEFENVPVEAAQFLESTVAIHPAPAALEAAQDRLVEKRFFKTLNIPTPPFQNVESRSDLDRAVASIGLPAVLKTRRDGYDGKGQRVVESQDDVNDAWDQLGGKPLILEGFVSFSRELSIISTRSLDGEFAYYPLVENEHSEGILSRTDAPAMEVSDRLQRSAEGYAHRIQTALAYVGVLAIEFFEVDGRLVANEMAPRVHNSGHWSIEGAETSQFENHVRAVAGFPLGTTSSRGRSTMLNLIGSVPDTKSLLAVDGAHLHLYGKEARPGRKLGHVTVRGDDAEAMSEIVSAVEQQIAEAVELASTSNHQTR